MYSASMADVVIAGSNFDVLLIAPPYGVKQSCCQITLLSQGSALREVTTFAHKPRCQGYSLLAVNCSNRHTRPK
jgi:hypothetical protein